MSALANHAFAKMNGIGNEIVVVDLRDSRAGVTAEMHVFRNGAHGSGLAQQDPALAEWPRVLANWLRAGGFMK